MRFYQDRRFLNWRNSILLIITAVIWVAFGIRVYFDDLNEQKVAEQFLASEQERHKQHASEIIAIFESSQKEYTSKMKTIQELAAHYNISVIFTEDDAGKAQADLFSGIALS